MRKQGSQGEKMKIPIAIGLFLVLIGSASPTFKGFDFTQALKMIDHRYRK